MMTIKSRRELLAAVILRYAKARGREREGILDEFVASTGYNRKYAIHLLHHPPPERRRQKRRKPRRYNAKVEFALLDVWKVANRIAAKRLVPCLEAFVEALERHGELRLDPETRALLLSMSISTADRLLRPHRAGPRGRGLATTKPGSLLKKSIPVRTFADWDDARPGFVEVDLVAHCGQSTDGQYLNSLDMTDIATGWTECLAVLNKSQRQVSKAIVAARQRFPFPLLGIDSDNGSEFINQTLYAYCQRHGITFTRSRPWQKNDSAHVEQKNGAVVRGLVGYDRFATKAAHAQLARVYRLARLPVTFFQPVQKLVANTRDGARTRRRYDAAQTPYQRLRAAGVLPPAQRADLDARYERLNPLQLRRELDRELERLWALAAPDPRRAPEAQG